MACKKAKRKRAKTRNKFTKKASRNTVNKLTRKFRVGSKVAIKINSSVHSAMPHHRYQGFTCLVSGKIGDCYTVELTVGSLRKYLIVHPAHLVSIKETKKEELKPRLIEAEPEQMVAMATN